MDKYEAIKHIIGALSGAGFFAFASKMLKNYLKGRKVEKAKKEYDRQIFLKLVDEVAEIKTDVKGIKTEMRELKDDARNKMNALEVAFWESDKDGQATYVSPALQIMLRQPAQKIERSGWISLLVESDRERIKKAWKFSIETLTVFDEIYSFNTSGGFEVKVHGMAYHRKDENGFYNGSFCQIKLYEL